MNDDAMPADIQFMPTPSDADLVANYGVLMSEIIPVGDPAMADRDGRADGRARRDDPDPNDFSLEAEGQREQNELDALEDADVDEDALLAPPVLTTTTPAPRAPAGAAQQQNGAPTAGADNNRATASPSAATAAGALGLLAAAARF